MIKKLSAFILVIVPFTFLIIGFNFDRTKYSTDPESAYLINGLNINMLKSVGHFDNPGTTVQIYSAVVLRIVHTLRFTGTDIQTDVLLHSEYYIEVLRYSMILVNALVLFFLGFVALSLFGNIWIALMLQISSFLSVTILEELFTKVAPEPFLFATVALLAMLLFKYHASDEKNKKSYTYFFALISGFGLATKMTYLPFLIVPFILLEGWQKKIRYSLLIIPSFILFTLPAIKGYPYMVKWFLNLGTHTGTYGQGSYGIFNPVQYLSSLKLIAINNTALLIEIIIASIVLAVFGLMRKKIKQHIPDSGFLILVSLLVAQAGTILMVAKYYHNNHYLFPALSAIGPVLAFCFLYLDQNLKAKGKKFLNLGLPFFVAGLLGISILNKPFLALAYQGYRVSNQDTDETMARLDRDYKGYVKTYYYPTSFNVYSSLWWGNVYARQFHNEKLKQLFPEGLFYNAWDKCFQLWNTSIPPGEFISRYGGRILLIGGPKTVDEMKMVEDAGLKLKKLYEGRLQVIYEVDTALSSLFHGKIHMDPALWTLKNDLETISSDKQWIMTGDEKFCKNAAVATDKPRSGRNSLLLPWADSYALNYELKNIKPGQVYEISMWRFGGNDDAYLVAAAKNTASFYEQSKGYLEKDANGWEKLDLSVKIPDNFAGDRLNVYLWNHGGKPSWFDDFELVQYK